MKILFDENVSPRLAARLADLYPGSEHISKFGLKRAADALIWDYARQHGFCIVTQDEDYAELSDLFGAPPKVIWLRCGNTRTREVERILRQNVHRLTELENSADVHILEIFS